MTHTSFTLNIVQFANFTAEIWNSHVYKSRITSDALWQGIASDEAKRQFSDGWSYCESKLEIVPGHRSWTYTTTSGTVMTVEQSSIKNSEGELPEPIITVSIPDTRKGGFHWTTIERVLQGGEYFEWYQLFYAVEGTPEFEEARRRGMTINVDKPEKELKNTTLADKESEDYDCDYIDYGDALEFDED